MADYKMRVIYWPNLGEKILDKHVGHVSVVIEKPDGTVEGPIGFGPVNVGAKKDAVFGSPGMVRDDSGYVNSGNGQQVSSKPITLSADEYAKVKGYIDEVKANPGRYSAPSDGSVEGTRNCIDFAEGALKAAGKAEKTQDLFEEGQLSGSLAGSEINRRREQKNSKDNLLNRSQAPTDGKAPQMAQAPKKKTSELTPEDAERQGMPLAEFLKAKSDELAANGSAIPDGPHVASASPELDRQILAEQQAQATQTQEQNAPADPRAESLIAMASTPIDNPGRSALLKPVETLTQGEMQDMIASAQGDYRGWRSGDPLKAHTYEKVQDWHVNIYGDGEQKYDGGKPVEPTPIRPIPEQPTPHTTPQGEDLWQATGRIGRKVAEAGAADGFDEAVKGLQRGLNILGEANPLPARSPAYGSYTKLGPVAEDGKYGPQTDFALKHATARLGPAKVDEAFALGRFNTFARQAQRSGNVDGLEQKAHSIFGPLFRDPKNDNAPKVEGGVFQETLNGIGGRRHDDWQPLKVDNWIGPKTTAAFGRILEEEDADGVTSAFGRGLGLL